MNRKHKLTIHKTLIRPVLMYGAENWILSKADESRLGVFERKIVRRICGPICEEATWRSRYNEELYCLYDETDLVTTINTFAASYLNTQGLNNSCLKSPASTLVDLTFQSRAFRSFRLNQLRNLSL